MRGCHSDSIYLVVRGAVVENSSKDALDSMHPKNDGAKYGHNHYVEVGGTAGLENILP
jgi:hypothetical protein